MNQKPNVHKACSQSLPVIDSREDLADILEAEGKTTGMAVGVRHGKFAEAVLSRWSNCTKYILMDPWEGQGERLMEKTKQKMKPFADKGVNVTFIRDHSSNGHKKIEKNSLDFIYIDSRHDFHSMKEDLEWMWPLLKEGGIFAGDDFCNADEEPRGRRGRRRFGHNWFSDFNPSQEWCTFADGNECVDNKAVKDAVEDFAKKHDDLQVLVPRRENQWVTWYMRKPVETVSK